MLTQEEYVHRVLELWAESQPPSGCGAVWCSTTSQVDRHRPPDQAQDFTILSRECAPD